MRVQEDPGSGRSPGGGHGNPLQYSCLENTTDKGAWRVIVRVVAKSDVTEQLTHTHTCGERLLLRCDGNAGNSFPTPQGKDPSSAAMRRKRDSTGAEIPEIRITRFIEQDKEHIFGWGTDIPEDFQCSHERV